MIEVIQLSRYLKLMLSAISITNCKPFNCKALNNETQKSLLRLLVRSFPMHVAKRLPLYDVNGNEIVNKISRRLKAQLLNMNAWRCRKEP
jgi:hypothetical protein